MRFIYDKICLVKGPSKTYLKLLVIFRFIYDICKTCAVVRPFPPGGGVFPVPSFSHFMWTPGITWGGVRLVNKTVRLPLLRSSYPLELITALDTQFFRGGQHRGNSHKLGKTSVCPEAIPQLPKRSGRFPTRFTKKNAPTSSIFSCFVVRFPPGANPETTTVNVGCSRPGGGAKAIPGEFLGTPPKAGGSQILIPPPPWARSEAPRSFWSWDARWEKGVGCERGVPHLNPTQ